MSNIIIILGSLLLMTMITSAQNIITTHYIISPTSGCNGVWAISVSSANPCGAPVTYSYNPQGCALFGSTSSGDTIFIPLCSIPCNLTMISSSGLDTCFCGTGNSAGIQNYLDNNSLISISPNPIHASDKMFVKINLPFIKDFQIQIMDINGHVLKNKTNCNSNVDFIDLTDLALGEYFITISNSNREWTTLQKFIIQ